MESIIWKPEAAGTANTQARDWRDIQVTLGAAGFESLANYWNWFTASQKAMIVAVTYVKDDFGQTKVERLVTEYNVVDVQVSLREALKDTVHFESPDRVVMRQIGLILGMPSTAWIALCGYFKTMQIENPLTGE